MNQNQIMIIQACIAGPEVVLNPGLTLVRCRREDDQASNIVRLTPQLFWDMLLERLQTKLNAISKHYCLISNPIEFTPSSNLARPKYKTEFTPHRCACVLNSF